MTTPDDRRTQACTLITGASSGIGYELAKVFARNGHGLVLVARSEDRLRRLAEDIQSAYGVTVQVIAKDLARPGAASEIAAELDRAGRRIDHLVNNAGMDVYGYFYETEWQHELDMIQLNLVSVTHLTKILLPDMRKHGFGRILNLGSTGSFAPSPLNTVYSATKAYIWSFSTALAEELRGSGITVTAYCPGAVRTEFQSRANIRDIRLLRFGVMDAARAAEGGYRAMTAGKRVVVPGLYNKAQVLFARLFPVSLVARMAKAMLQPLS
jgi:short-subunit dehydrogenase